MSSRQLPSVDSAALLGVLESALGDHFGRRRSVVHLARGRCAYSSSFALEELALTLDDGARLELVFKDVGPGITEDEGRWTKPAFLYHPRREIEVYRSILSRARLGTATCYGAVASAHLQRYWLFLERVPGVPLLQIGDFRRWLQAARWLGVMHTRLRPQSDLPDPGGDPVWLRYDETYYRRWLRRASRIARESDPASTEILARILEREDRLVTRLLALPRTFIHGEFYPTNVLVQQGALDPRLCPVDWEMAAIGPGLMDLAALSSGDWPPEQQAAMASAYREVLAAEPGTPPGLDELVENLDWCRLFQALTWLGWAPRLDAPKNQATNWSREVARLAGRLGL